MNYYVVRYECDTGCGEIDEAEPDMGLPLHWEKIDGEELCPECVARARKSDDEDES